MPKYGGNLSKRDKGYKRINEDCSFYLPTYVLGVTLTDKNIKHLVNRKLYIHMICKGRMVLPFVQSSFVTRKIRNCFLHEVNNSNIKSQACK